MNSKVGTCKICIVRHGYFPQDPRVLKEVKALLGLRCEVDVICLRGEHQKSFEIWNKVNIYRLPLEHKRLGLIHYIFEYAISFVMFFGKLTILHLKRRYDVIQVNTLPDFLVFTAFIPKLMGARIALDLHELMPEYFISKFKNTPLIKILYRLIVLLECLSIKFADLVFTVSPIQVKVLKKRYPNLKSIIVHNVPDETLFYQNQVEDEIISDTNNKAILMYHGTLLEGYGVQVLISAIPMVLQEITDLQVYIIGDGEFLPHLQKQASDLGLLHVITFTGKVPLNLIPYYIKKATIGIVPLLKDGYMELCAPNKLFEYVALKKPVIAANLPGIRVYFDERQIELFNPGDPEDLARKIISLLKNPQRRVELAQEAWKVYKIIRWEKTKLAYVKGIKQLFEKTVHFNRIR